MEKYSMEKKIVEMAIHFISEEPRTYLVAALHFLDKGLLPAAGPGPLASAGTWTCDRSRRIRKTVPSRVAAQTRIKFSVPMAATSKPVANPPITWPVIRLALNSGKQPFALACIAHHAGHAPDDQPDQDIEDFLAQPQGRIQPVLIADERNIGQGPARWQSSGEWLMYRTWRGIRLRSAVTPNDMIMFVMPRPMNM